MQVYIDGEFAKREMMVAALRLVSRQSIEKPDLFPYKPRMIAGEIINFRNPL